ncbi:MAG: hypothetical protein KA210_02360 [Bacteroidia bacterium]|nr:hypothetical protein [Bacteroidia bacterium]
MKQLQNFNALRTDYLLISVFYVLTTSLLSLSFFGFVVVIFQALLLLFLIFYKPSLAFPYVILSFGSSIEFNTFINNGQSPLYNLSNVKLFGLNVGIWMFIIVIPSIIQGIMNLRKKVIFNFWQYIILFGFLTMYFVAISSSFLSYIFTTGGLSNFDIGYLISLSYLQLWPLVCLFCSIVYIKINENGLLTLKLTVFYTFIAVLISSFLINFVGVRGTYGYSLYYFAPTLIFICPLFLILLKDPFFQISRRLAIVIFFSFIVLPIILFDLAGGKVIIFTLMALLLFSKKFKFRNMFFAFIAMGFLFFVIYSFMSDESLLKSKIDEILSLFNFFSGYWYELLEPSTRFRLDEFINIFQHYKLNPFFIPTGFGIVSGAPDYIGGYGQVADGSFPGVEYTFNYFISYHEICSFLIKYGLMGFALLFLVLRKAFKFKEKLPFLVVGSIWLILFWGYSFTLAITGATILAIGIMELPSRDLQFNHK